MWIKDLNGLRSRAWGPGSRVEDADVDGAAGRASEEHRDPGGWLSKVDVDVSPELRGQHRDITPLATHKH